MSTSLTHKDVYYKLKAILDGCDTVLDAIPFCNSYAEKYPQMKSMIFSYLNGRSYNDTIDIKTKQNMLNDICLCETKEDASTLMSKVIARSSDDVYKRAMERIINCKRYKIIGPMAGSVSVNICKKCPHPHCGHIINMATDTQYVICGYTDPNHGYDWNGCGKDWCFQCNKILCKSWEFNRLHLEMNRTHDNDCCSQHANVNDHKYPDDYCQCNGIHMHKKTTDIIKTMEM